MGPGFESPLGHHVVADFVSFATTFYSKKSSLIHYVAPPFRIEPAALGFDSVFGANLKVNASKVFTLSSSSQASYRLRRVFYASHQKLIVRSFCCSSLPNRIRFAGFRFGLERTERFCLKSVRTIQVVVDGILYIKTADFCERTANGCLFWFCHRVLPL